MPSDSQRCRIRLSAAVLAIAWFAVVGILVGKSRQQLSDVHRAANAKLSTESIASRAHSSNLNSIDSLSATDFDAPPRFDSTRQDAIPEFPLARVLHSTGVESSNQIISLCQLGTQGPFGPAGQFGSEGHVIQQVQFSRPAGSSAAQNFQWNDAGPGRAAPNQSSPYPGGNHVAQHGHSEPYYGQQGYSNSGDYLGDPYGSGQYDSGYGGTGYDGTGYDEGGFSPHQNFQGMGAAPAFGLPWQAFAQGDFVEPARQAFSPEYRVRVGDNLTFIYQVIRTQISEPYRLSVGDVISIESDSHEELRQKNLTIMPDGTVSISPLQSIYVAGMTFVELKAFLQERFAAEGLRSPRITVVPVTIDLPNRDLRDAVDGRAGEGGQRVSVTVTWDGYVWLPKINAVPVVGLSLAEISSEVNARYAATVPGIEITPVLNTSAPALAYVLGEVGQQGRIEIRRPTTALQAITQAGGHLPGANMRDVIILRRTSDWRLIATRVNLHDSAWGRGVSCDDIWLHDSDIVIVPRTRIERIAELVELYFTRSLYGVLPNQGFVFSYNSNSSIF